MIFRGAVVSLVIALVAIGNVLFWRKLEEGKVKEVSGNKLVLGENQTGIKGMEGMKN